MAHIQKKFEICRQGVRMKVIELYEENALLYGHADTCYQNREVSDIKRIKQ